MKPPFHTGDAVLWSGLLPGMLALLMSAAPAQAQQKMRNVSELYSQNCAACHGDNMEGGQAESLLDDNWKHGSDDPSLRKIIAEGSEENGMPPWKPELSDAEIRGMVVFIREKREQTRRKAQPAPKPAGEQAVQTKLHDFVVKPFVDGFSTPWAMAFMPDGGILVTELKGTLRVVRDGKLLPEPVKGTPNVAHAGQGGLMEVALHPGFKTNGWVYLGFSDPAPASGNSKLAMTAVVRGRIKDNQWTDEQVIFRAPYELYRPGTIHFGTRFVFDKGYLFFPIGERGHMHDAQDLTRPNGKVHRVFDDGRIPPDNPFVNEPNAIKSIWSYGHRNPQGLDQHPVTGDLWDTEHGPRGGDELNLVLKGRNYGWPVITYGMNYNGTPMTDLTAKEGMEQPVLHWTPSIAVCGIDFYTGDRFPKWKNHLFVTALAQEEVHRVVIEGRQVTEDEVLFKGIGRVRDIANGPDGYLYVVFNRPDRIARLEPVAP